MDTQKTAIRLLRLLPLLFHFLSAENEFPHSMAAPASGATGRAASRRTPPSGSACFPTSSRWQGSRWR